MISPIEWKLGVSLLKAGKRSPPGARFSPSSEVLDPYKEWHRLLECAASQQPSPAFWAAVDELKARPGSEADRLEELKALMLRSSLWF